MKLGVLFEGIPILESVHWAPNRTIRRITSDSRSIEPGDIFVACPGTRMDGHDFLGQAVQAKAAVIVYENTPEISIPHGVTAVRVDHTPSCLALLLNRYYGRPDQKVKLLGVTGTNGKTTIAYLLHKLLREKSSAAYVGTLWYDVSGDKRPALNTTPSAEVLIPLLAEMAQEKVAHCILEVSSHALRQRRVYGLNFEVGIFTQLSQDHLDYHKDMEQYFQAKMRLFAGPTQTRNVLTNLDCPYGRRLLEMRPDAKTFSLSRKADFQAVDMQTTFSGSQFGLRLHGREVPFQIRLPLSHNVANVLAVLGAIDMLGYRVEDFRDQLKEIPGIPGRMENILGADGFQVFVDYAHTPHAIENVLSEARKLKPKRILTLFGCGGDRDRSKRPIMAQAALRYSDIVVLTSDNPRSEDPEMILEDVKRGITADDLKHSQVFEVLERQEAVEKLMSLAQPGDAVFILGKGHENYQILGEGKFPFDDREVARACLKRKKRVFLS